MTSISSLIPNEEKIEILTASKDMVVRDIYRYCAMLGIDADTLDIESYEAEIPVSRHEYVQLENSCKTLININAKLSALGS
jgi:hypothetical protein